MLGRKSSFAEKTFKGNYIATGFLPDKDLTHQLLDNWRAFNKKFIPVFLEQNPNKTKIMAGLACAMLWTIAKGIHWGMSSSALMAKGIITLAISHATMNTIKE